MPEFILPEEADHCPHCGKVLREPPNCCEAMEAEYRKEWNERLLESSKQYPEPDWPPDDGLWDEDRDDDF